MIEINKLSNGISGIAGEYFVAGELSRRGFMASVTLRNNDSVDIHASKLSDNKVFAIQVKTKQYGGRSWLLSKKSESLQSDNLFYVFVSLNDILKRPDYFIVPSNIIAERMKNGHAHWLATLGKKGQPHRDTNLRQFTDVKGEFLERWDLLK